VTAAYDPDTHLVSRLDYDDHRSECVWQIDASALLHLPAETRMRLLSHRKRRRAVDEA